MAIDPDKLDALLALGLGFAFAGLVASSFELLARRPMSFNLLNEGGIRALLSVPVLVFSAPMIILRNTIRGRRIEHRPVHFVFLATIIACGWSLMSGRVVLDIAHFLTGA